LTEIEAPLWAFKEIMDWACDAHKTGSRFVPEQKKYQSQIETVKKWVGMDHMRLEVVTVQLPGIRKDDMINGKTFDFINQFHSLLSDLELNIPTSLVVHPLDPFQQYESPDGLLHESLSGSWYKEA
jgi:hypothetical protein